MKVTVLGCGPAGLMAVHGIFKCGEDFYPGAGIDIDLQIISHKVKSQLFGCQYLHLPIPRMPQMPQTTVSYRLRGEVDGYRDKVYGKDFYGTVSPEDLVGDHQAWDIRATYDWLWKKYQHLIIDGEVGPRTVWSLDGVVVNSIPRPVLCHANHDFQSTKIVAAGDAPELGIDIGSQFRCDEDSVLCNGEEAPSWYRLSRVFGHTTVEWPGHIRVPITTAATVTKPTSTDCVCHPGLIHVGRYGTWKKGVLSHEAYFTAYREMLRVLKKEEDEAAQAGA